MLDPEQIAQDEQLLETLRATAALAGGFYDALKAAGIPEATACDMVRDWHYAQCEPAWPIEAADE